MSDRALSGWSECTHLSMVRMLPLLEIVKVETLSLRNTCRTVHVSGELKMHCRTVSFGTIFKMRRWPWMFQIRRAAVYKKEDRHVAFLVCFCQVTCLLCIAVEIPLNPTGSGRALWMESGILLRWHWCIGNVPYLYSTFSRDLEASGDFYFLISQFHFWL